MFPTISRPVCTGLLLLLAGCGASPEVNPSSPGAPPNQNLQEFPFTGVIDPVSGRLRLVTGPQAALVGITEDQNGDPNTVAPGTAQIWGPVVTFASGGVGYPAGCNTAAPMVMSADVEVFSGFNEQLRNVYARIDFVSGGQTFCTKASVSGFGGVLNPNSGLYLYQPLDRGTNASSALRRTLAWSMNLPDNGVFWFRGTLLAEIFPQLPTKILPADNATFLTGNATAEVAFSWKDDNAANGANNDGFVVPRPTGAGAELTIMRCGVDTAAFNATDCTTTFLAPTVTTNEQATALLPIGFWYQWTLRPVFRLPGDTATTVGTQASTRHFRASRG